MSVGRVNFIAQTDAVAHHDESTKSCIKAILSACAKPIKTKILGL